MKYKSRKFWVSILVMVSSMILPIAYQKIGISESITIAALAIIASVGVAYGGLNLIGKKLGEKE